jgi:DNA-binding transcriptional ArsR family regulator
MVNYQAHALDRVLAALVDPTRRAILSRFGETEGRSISAVTGEI